MIEFSAIWWLFPSASLAFVVSSFCVTRARAKEGSKSLRALTAFGALLGFLAMALPLFEQPVVSRPPVNAWIGAPLVAIGLVGRLYPMAYLRRQGTSTALDGVERLVDSGPYSMVRHQQYSFGFVLLLGWFVTKGGLCSLMSLPPIAGMIYTQALLEEAHILVPLFGEAYVAYRKHTGMFVPRLKQR